MAAAGNDTPNRCVPTVFMNRRTGRMVVASRELAAVTAHSHGNIMKHVRRIAALPHMDGSVFWYEYVGRRSNRIFPCAHLTREALLEVFDFMHNVPGCRNVRGVLDRYLEMIDQREDFGAIYAARAEKFGWGIAEPASDDDIRPPDDEPEDLFEPLPPPSSWEINAAVSTLERAGMERRIFAPVEAWNQRRLEGLLTGCRSWTEVGAIFSTNPPDREAA